MADKSSLGFLGIAFGGVTFAVMLIAFMVVRGHVEGRLVLETNAMSAQVASIDVR